MVRIINGVAVAGRATPVVSSSPNVPQTHPFIQQIQGHNEINHDVWLDTVAIILLNVRIGTCAFVSAEPVATTKDPLNFTAIWGVP